MVVVVRILAASIWMLDALGVMAAEMAEMAAEDIVVLLLLSVAEAVVVGLAVASVDGDRHGFGDLMTPRSSDDDAVLFAPERRDFVGSRGMMRGFGIGSNATSIISTSAMRRSHVRVGEIFVGRVMVADIVYDILPFSNYFPPTIVSN